MLKQKRVAIMGTGKIAGVMASTLKKMKNIKCYGVASRSEEKAQKFANEYGIKVAYASYEEMMLDDKIDLVYIATPHSEHYANMKLCIENGKNVLCEKAFTANKVQAEEIFALAKEKGVFVTEAMWTRYMPLLTYIRGTLGSGIIGDPTMLICNLAYNVADKQRLIDPMLAGGALLDLGVYTINFAAMMFGTDIDKITSTCTKTDTGVDEANSITFTYKDGKMAILNSTMKAVSDRRGVIYGTHGYLVVENINNFESVTVYDLNHKPIKTMKAPKQITGYEYEVISSFEAMEKGELECWEMPHNETLRIMEIMDGLRREWGIKYPFENETQDVPAVVCSEVYEGSNNTVASEQKMELVKTDEVIMLGDTVVELEKDVIDDFLNENSGEEVSAES